MVRGRYHSFAVHVGKARPKLEAFSAFRGATPGRRIVQQPPSAAAPAEPQDHDSANPTVSDLGDEPTTGGRDLGAEFAPGGDAESAAHQQSSVCGSDIPPAEVARLLRPPPQLPDFFTRSKHLHLPDIRGGAGADGAGTPHAGARARPRRTPRARAPPGSVKAAHREAPGRGPRSPRPLGTPEELRVSGEQLNRAALHAMANNQLPQSHRLLQTALKAFRASAEAAAASGRARSVAVACMEAVTLNNLSCLHTMQGQPNTALLCARKALRLSQLCHKIAASEKDVSDAEENRSSSLLNLAAVLGNLGRHREAAQHASIAVESALEQRARLADAAAAAAGTGPGDPALAPAPTPTQSVAAVALYNLGTQLEGLKRRDKAERAYAEAERIAAEDLGPAHPLLDKIRAARSKVAPPEAEAAKADDSSAGKTKDDGPVRAAETAAGPAPSTAPPAPDESAPES